MDSVTGDDDPVITTDDTREDTTDDTTDRTVATTEVVEDTVPESTVETTVPSTTAPPVVETDGDGQGDDDGHDELSDKAEVTTTVELVDDPDTAFDETECAEGNHGKTVSSVAKATPGGPGKGPRG